MYLAIPSPTSNFLAHSRRLVWKLCLFIRYMKRKKENRTGCLQSSECKLLIKVELCSSKTRTSLVFVVIFLIVVFVHGFKLASFLSPDKCH